MATRRSSDSFFIRRSVALPADASFVESALDLGAFVDALGESVLRIHNIAVQYTDSTGRAILVKAANDSAAVNYQLTTQTQTDIVKANNKSVIASGTIYATNAFGTDEFPVLSHDMDVLPQLWTNGYLVAVETIYLGGSASAGWDETVYASIVIEASSERMSKAAGLALALSQQ
jgi:hypothetical protein